MQKRSLSVLLTSYAIANGMAERGMIMRILHKEATPTAIARMLAINLETRRLLRQAVFAPTDDNFRRADVWITKVLEYATPVLEPAPAESGALTP